MQHLQRKHRPTIKYRKLLQPCKNCSVMSVVCPLSLLPCNYTPTVQQLAYLMKSQWIPCTLVLGGIWCTHRPALWWTFNSVDFGFLWPASSNIASQLVREHSNNKIECYGSRSGSLTNLQNCSCNVFAIWLVKHGYNRQAFKVCRLRCPEFNHYANQLPTTGVERTSIGYSSQRIAPGRYNLSRPRKSPV